MKAPYLEAVVRFWSARLRRRIVRLRREDLEYYANALGGVPEARPLLPAGALKRFFATFLLWSVLARGVTAPLAAFGVGLVVLVSGLVGFVAVALVDAGFEPAAAGDVPPDVADLGPGDLLAVEDELLVEREFAPRARTEAVGGRILVGTATVLLFALLAAGMKHLPAAAVQTPLLYGVVLGALAAALFGAEWGWRRLPLLARVALRATARYWPASLSLALWALYVGGWIRPGT